MTGKFRGAGARDVLPGMRPLEIFNLNLDGRQELAGIVDACSSGKRIPKLP